LETTAANRCSRGDLDRWRGKADQTKIIITHIRPAQAATMFRAPSRKGEERHDRATRNKVHQGR